MALPPYTTELMNAAEVEDKRRKWIKMVLLSTGGSGCERQTRKSGINAVDCVSILNNAFIFLKKDDFSILFWISKWRIVLG
ncbi:hypothetical protein Y032_0604g542 [Ancylostoma ceylanicum]|uniref:Uncharacterized protein n=1 Tax=Ancylostoma ceylanicum TaxID=53326 RepID=A0A016WNM5_9BILA|nr:hypothetical protein Y032_0604g542 [Ancylostoma ceylanicum]